MSTKKGFDKVLGWFVEREEEPVALVTEDVEVVPDSGERAPQAQRSSGPVARPPAAPSGASFAEVYARAGVPAEEHDRTERALELLRSLPPNVPVDARRAIVTASLAAFGIPIERILETAAAEVRALDGHVAAGQQRSQQSLGAARARIEALEAEIAEVRRLMAAEAHAQEQLSSAIGAERARIRALFDFFGKSV
ncbi:Hypothetical protein A7982_01483 [Minicystis rosea]|nr:Hypothetical protein A7982_01483 [Minicystis rosea]